MAAGSLDEYAPVHVVVDGTGEHRCDGSGLLLDEQGRCTGCGLTVKEIRAAEDREDEPLEFLVSTEAPEPSLGPEHRN